MIVCAKGNTLMAMIVEVSCDAIGRSRTTLLVGLRIHVMRIRGVGVPTQPFSHSARRTVLMPFETLVSP
jgi:hypothetical protein